MFLFREERNTDVHEFVMKFPHFPSVWWKFCKLFVLDLAVDFSKWWKFVECDLQWTIMEKYENSSSSKSQSRLIEIFIVISISLDKHLRKTWTNFNILINFCWNSKEYIIYYNDMKLILFISILASPEFDSTQMLYSIEQYWGISSLWDFKTVSRMKEEDRRARDVKVVSWCDNVESEMRSLSRIFRNTSWIAIPYSHIIFHGIILLNKYNQYIPIENSMVSELNLRIWRISYCTSVTSQWKNQATNVCCCSICSPFKRNWEISDEKLVLLRDGDK